MVLFIICVILLALFSFLTWYFIPAYFNKYYGQPNSGLLVAILSQIFWTGVVIAFGYFASKT